MMDDITITIEPVESTMPQLPDASCATANPSPENEPSAAHVGSIAQLPEASIAPQRGVEPSPVLSGETRTEPRPPLKPDAAE